MYLGQAACVTCCVRCDISGAKTAFGEVECRVTESGAGCLIRTSHQEQTDVRDRVVGVRDILSGSRQNPNAVVPSCP